MGANSSHGVSEIDPGQLRTSESLHSDDTTETSDEDSRSNFPLLEGLIRSASFHGFQNSGDGSRPPSCELDDASSSLPLLKKFQSASFSNSFSRSGDLFKPASCGIGVTFYEDRDGFKRVQNVGESSPCAALLHADDILEKIDGETVEGMGWMEFGQRLIGPEGSCVRLTIRSMPRHLPQHEVSDSFGEGERREGDSRPSGIVPLDEGQLIRLAGCYDEQNELKDIVVVRAFMPASYFNDNRYSPSSETVKGIIEVVSRIGS